MKENNVTSKNKWLKMRIASKTLGISFIFLLPECSTHVTAQLSLGIDAYSRQCVVMTFLSFSDLTPAGVSTVIHSSSDC